MNYAIIAAGEGSRLAAEGIGVPKPLVPLGGKPMLERLLNLLSRHRAQSISIIINEDSPEVRDLLFRWGSEQHLSELGLPEGFKFHLLARNTPSSMHSLAALAEVMPVGKFCLLTVDSVFDEATFRRYIDAWELTMPHDADGMFGVTPYVDDEKPLYVEMESYGNRSVIHNFHEMPLPGQPVYVSGGIYGLDTRTAFPVLSRCLKEGVSRMRNYQRALVRSGLLIEGWTFDKVIDVDHASDIAKAEALLRETGATTTGKR